MSKILLRGLLVAGLLCLVFLPDISLAQIKATASSVEGVNFPQYAVDNNMGTRWSSDFSDPQWLELDLGKEQAITGLIIHWEDAFAADYDIMLSVDEKNWTTVYEAVKQDGKTDDIYFRPTQARYIRIFCRKRATGWGNSIYEIKIKGADKQPLIELAAENAQETQALMDGSLEEGLELEAGAPAEIIIDLRQVKEIGGFQFNWGDDYATDYKILTSADKDSWHSAYKMTASNGGKDLIYINKTKARYLKIVLDKSSNNSFILKELSLKGPDEAASPQKFYEVLAEESPAGYYPEWLYKKQTYWTVVGADDDSQEAVISESGTIEPYKGSFNIMPYIYTDNKLITAKDCKAELQLIKGYLPIPSVTLEHEGIILKETIFAAGKKDKSATYCWLVLENKTSKTLKGSLYLAIRPLQLNPPWQYGGMAEIERIDYKKTREAAGFKINNNYEVQLLTEPAGFGASYLSNQDIITYVAENRLPDETSIYDPQGLGSAAVKFDFDLLPNKRKNIYFVMPLSKNYQPEALTYKEAPLEFNRRLAEAASFWDEKLGQIEIDIPQKEIVDTFKVNVAYLLINKDLDALQPGARNYDRSWIRDGAVMSAALLRGGYYEEIKGYLDWVSSHQRPSGEIPCIMEQDGSVPGWAMDWTEWDGQGAYVFAVAEYYRFTKDKAFLRDKFDNVIKALEFLENIRKQRLTDKYKGTYFYGILPESNSHEGYFPPQHSLWDDFWALKGWKEGQFIAGVLGEAEYISWMKGEENALRDNLVANIRLIQERRNIDFIPGCFDKADFDATSTAISVWPSQEAEHLMDVKLMETLNRYYRDTLLPRLSVGLQSAYTPYEMRTAIAFLMLGEKQKALTMLNYFLTDMRPRPWKHWGEVVHEVRDRPQYIGDMPHTWIGAICVNLIRSLFVYEEGDTLVLAAGVDNDWLKEQPKISVKNLPTHYGRISYSLKKEDDKIIFSMDKMKEKPDNIVLIAPDDRAVSEVKGKRIKADIKGNKITFQAPPDRAVIYFKNKDTQNECR